MKTIEAEDGAGKKPIFNTKASLTIFAIAIIINLPFIHDWIFLITLGSIGGLVGGFLIPQTWRETFLRNWKRPMTLLICGVISCYSYGQPVGIVSAPILETEVASQTSVITQQSAVLTTMNGVVTALEKADREYKEAMQKATWLQNLQTAQQILFMIENLVCTSKNLSARMGVVGRNSCLMNYRFDMAIIKVQQSADYLGIILTAGVTMTAAERMRSLDDVIKNFNEAQEMMVRLNRNLNTDMLRLRMTSKTLATVNLVVNYNRSKR